MCPGGAIVDQMPHKVSVLPFRSFFKISWNLPSKETLLHYFGNYPSPMHISFVDFPLIINWGLAMTVEAADWHVQNTQPKDIDQDI